VAGYDAVVVGAGPNGLAAAITLARAGRSVLVVEAEEEVGGGLRTGELTLPGFAHDICSAVHPLAVASPFFRELPLAVRGVEWVQPPAPLGHALDERNAVMLERSPAETAAQLGLDGRAYRRLMEPLVERWQELALDALAPLHWPVRPVVLARFGARAVRSASGLLRSAFAGKRARALLGGCAAHSMLPLDRRPTAAFALVLALMGHAVGWPFPRGGAGRLAAALAAELRALGGVVRTGWEVRRLEELPPARAIFLDLVPARVAALAADRLPPRYLRRLLRYRYGPAVFKLDWALAGPIPWRVPALARAGTVHLGGTLEEMEVAEAAPWRGETAERPFTIVVQHTLFDPSRAPAGRHTAWAYCHVPNGSTADMTARIEARVEHFAPGFRDLVLARSAWGPADFERHDPNLVGGDINGGAMTLGQLFFRPVPRASPYTTPVPGLYLCSAATPPGGGVHGLCGWHAARAALRNGL